MEHETNVLCVINTCTSVSSAEVKETMQITLQLLSRVQQVVIFLSYCLSNDHTNNIFYNHMHEGG